MRATKSHKILKSMFIQSAFDYMNIENALYKFKFIIIIIQSTWSKECPAWRLISFHVACGWCCSQSTVSNHRRWRRPERRRSWNVQTRASNNRHWARNLLIQTEVDIFKPGFKNKFQNPTTFSYRTEHSQANVHLIYTKQFLPKTWHKLVTGDKFDQLCKSARRFNKLA